MATLPLRSHLRPRSAPAELLHSTAASKLRFPPPHPRVFCTVLTPRKKKSGARAVIRAGSPKSDELKEGWLNSLSCPFQQHPEAGIVEGDEDSGPRNWVLGIDPDVSGAVAILKDEGAGDGDGDAAVCTAQVFDTPHLQVLVGKRVRNRLDTRSIVQLLQSIGAPVGTIAYIEQSTPFPQDGKQGWWSGGFTYGLWIGILVSSGFSVVPVASRTWKDHFQLSQSSLNKDASREAAVDLYPYLSSSLKRKKDHGRAEALLIATFGRSRRLQQDSSSKSIEAPPSMLLSEDSCAHEI